MLAKALGGPRAGGRSGRMGSGGEIKARARWEGNQLVETWAGGRGPGRTLTYGLSDDGSRLIVTEHRPLPGQDQPVTLKLVHDRTE